MGDTIVALASALPGAARAVLRLSGDRAAEIARGLDLPRGSRVTLFRAPRSYTREDLAEVELPASRPLVDAAIDACARGGARLARPGEFTFRAYRNGRIDLAQAESVLSAIQAGSRDELEASMAALSGEFSRLVEALRGSILDLCAEVEANIDFVDQEIEILPPARLAPAVEALAESLQRLLSDSRARESSAEVLTVLIYGPASAGKSTLFNRLVPGSESIVSRTPGTTRDVIFGETALPGLEARVRFADSAGVLEEAGPLDAQAMRRTHEALRSADLVILLADATRPEAGRGLEPRLGSKPRLVVTNKRDLAPAPEPAVSALTGDGLDRLRIAVAEALKRGLGAEGSARFAVSARQRAALHSALFFLRQAVAAASLGWEFAASDLREAAAELGQISGRAVADEILQRVFSRFCIGK
jgi:tRNA modification GTPase